MAWLPLNIEKEEVENRTADGLKAISFPSTGLTESRLALPQCVGCDKAGEHGPPARAISIEIPFGEHPYQRVPSAVRFDVAEFNRIQNAMFWIHQAYHGYIDDRNRMNVGGSGDNPSQTVSYEVTGASGNTVTLKGPNPKRLQIGRLRENPAWPLPDPVTGQPQRLIPETALMPMPGGAIIEPLRPSALWNKKQYVIRRVELPSSDADEVEFDVTVWQGSGTSNLTQPIDLAFPPEDDRYFCNIRFEALYPQRWRNLQAPLFSQFAKRVQTETIIPSNRVITLRDSQNGNTRVLFPGMLQTSAIRAHIEWQNGSIISYQQNVLASKLSTTQSGSGWTTTLDLSDFIEEGEVDDVEEIRIELWAERRAEDEGGRPFQSACSHSQLHPQYDQTNRICVNASCDQRASYQQQCWLPNASGFALGTTGLPSSKNPGGTFGSGFYLPQHFDGEFLSGLWHRTGWFAEQPAVGFPRFTLGRPGNAGPSLQSILGGWLDEVPAGLFSTRFLVTGRAAGERITYSDDDDNDLHAIAHGAFYQAANSMQSNGDIYEWDATTAPRRGVLADIVSGWASGKNGMRYPYRSSGGLHVYRYATTPGSYRLVNQMREAAEAFIPNIGSATDLNVRTQIEGMI